jgi:hypothetical protein
MVGHEDFLWLISLGREEFKVLEIVVCVKWNFEILLPEVVANMKWKVSM